MYMRGPLGLRRIAVTPHRAQQPGTAARGAEVMQAEREKRLTGHVVGYGHWLQRAKVNGTRGKWHRK